MRIDIYFFGLFIGAAMIMFVAFLKFNNPWFLVIAVMLGYLVVWELADMFADYCIEKMRRRKRYETLLKD